MFFCCSSQLQEELEKSDAFVLVFSVVDKSSFTRVEQLVQSLHDMDLIRSRPVIIVANKIDLARSRAVSTQGEFRWNVLFFLVSVEMGNRWGFCVLCRRSLNCFVQLDVEESQLRGSNKNVCASFGRFRSFRLNLLFFFLLLRCNKWASYGNVIFCWSKMIFIRNLFTCHGHVASTVSIQLHSNSVWLASQPHSLTLNNLFKAIIITIKTKIITTVEMCVVQQWMVPIKSPLWPSSLKTMENCRIIRECDECRLWFIFFFIRHHSLSIKHGPAVPNDV